MEALLKDVELNYDRKRVVGTDGNRMYAQMSKDYGYDCGITICGEYDAFNHFRIDHYFPYYIGSQISSQEPVSIERHVDRESYAGACDDPRLGLILIFHLINPCDYLNVCQGDVLREYRSSLSLSALASSGKILLPVARSHMEEEQIRSQQSRRNNLISAARNGDQEAMESLTMEDIDTYSAISKRIQQEDLYSIVETSMMPRGMECDQYSIVGEILDCSRTVNSRTGEAVCQMGVNVNDVRMDVCINAADLLGEPAPGRRFKGDIWLQGHVEF